MEAVDQRGGDDDAVDRYLPALRWRVLTPAYDVVVRVTSGEHRFKQRLLEWADPQPGERVLDVACGTGTLLMEANARIGDVDLVGVDRDGDVLRRAMKKPGPTDASVELCRGDARFLPIASGSVDLVMSSLFFHHLAGDAKRMALAEIRRVLRPDGRLAVADWGAPRGPASRVGAWVVRSLDGDEPTRENFAGDLRGIIEGAAFENVIARERVGVPLGVVDVITARPAVATAGRPG